MAGSNEDTLSLRVARSGTKLPDTAGKPKPAGRVWKLRTGGSSVSSLLPAIVLNPLYVFDELLSSWLNDS